MRRYKFLEHTADAKFQAFGRTMEEAFAHAALALASLMWDWKVVGKSVEYAVEVRGRDIQQLLYNFLEEVIYLFEVKSFLLGSVKDVRIEKHPGEYHLQSVFRGDDNPGKYGIFGDVKAVTYNEMAVLENDSVTLQVVVDI